MSIRVYHIPAAAAPSLTTVEPTLDGMQTAVGGMLEAVTLSEDACMYLEEEGKLKGSAPNVIATRVVEHFHPGFAGRDFICGDAIVTGSTDDGDEVDVPTHIVAIIQDVTGVDA